MIRSLELPPALSGSERSQLTQLYGYLYRMAEQLNVTLQTMQGEPAGIVFHKNGAAETAAQSADALQALIVNTAEVIHSEMDKLEYVLRGEYTALSDRWGTYREEMQQNIRETAEGVVREFGFTSALEALDEQAAGFSRYQRETRGYICQGFVERDEAGVPVVGIAIGQGLIGTETEVNGETLLALDPTQSCAFYTAERVSFRIGGQEVAYLSNRRLYVADVQVTGGLTVGRWLMDGIGGLTVKYIG